MHGFYVEDVPREGTLLFGGALMYARLDSRGKLEIDFGTHLQALLAIRAHAEMAQNYAVNASATTTPVPAAATLASATAPSLAPAATITHAPASSVPKRGNGESQAVQTPTPTPPPKRRGRPPGSTNKVISEAASFVEDADQPKKPRERASRSAT